MTVVRHYQLGLACTLACRYPEALESFGLAVKTIEDKIGKKLTGSYSYQVPPNVNVPFFQVIPQVLCSSSNESFLFAAKLKSEVAAAKESESDKPKGKCYYFAAFEKGAK